MNIVQFKMKLVESLIGRTIDCLFEVGGVRRSNINRYASQKM